MALKKIKAGAKKVAGKLKSVAKKTIAPSGKKVKYTAPKEKNQSTLTAEQMRKLKNRRKTASKGPAQYGDKGYRPSSGKGVGH